MALACMLKDWIEKDKKAQQAKDYAEGVAEGSAAMKAVLRTQDKRRLSAANRTASHRPT